MILVFVVAVSRTPDAKLVKSSRSGCFSCLLTHGKCMFVMASLNRTSCRPLIYSLTHAY
jgi:hypothetical protein